MEHIGIDVHQKYSEICVVSGQGEIVLRQRITTNGEGMPYTRLLFPQLAILPRLQERAGR